MIFLIFQRELNISISGGEGCSGVGRMEQVVTAGLSLPNWETASCGDNCGFYYIMLWYAGRAGQTMEGSTSQTFRLLNSQIINWLHYKTRSQCPLSKIFIKHSGIEWTSCHPSHRAGFDSTSRKALGLQRIILDKNGNIFLLILNCKGTNRRFWLQMCVRVTKMVKGGDGAVGCCWCLCFSTHLKFVWELICCDSGRDSWQVCAHCPHFRHNKAWEREDKRDNVTINLCWPGPAPGYRRLEGASGGYSPSDHPQSSERDSTWLGETRFRH